MQNSPAEIAFQNALAHIHLREFTTLRPTTIELTDGVFTYGTSRADMLDGANVKQSLAASVSFRPGARLLIEKSPGDTLTFSLQREGEAPHDKRVVAPHTVSAASIHMWLHKLSQITPTPTATEAPHGNLEDN